MARAGAYAVVLVLVLSSGMSSTVEQRTVDADHRVDWIGGFWRPAEW